MKITAFHSGQILVNITAADINLMLPEDPLSVLEAVRLLRDATCVIAGIPDWQVAKLTPYQKQVVHTFLVDQSKRFEEKPHDNHS